MSKKILLDAAHKEETRLAVLEDGILQDFDREALSIKQLKGNIYLAKITRVEPSLQAAFVNYGGDRHGFLPFADIHPDYYIIPEEKEVTTTVSEFGEEKEKTELVFTPQKLSNKEVTDKKLIVSHLKHNPEEEKVIFSQVVLDDSGEKQNIEADTNESDNETEDSYNDSHTPRHDDSDDDYSEKSPYDDEKDDNYKLYKKYKIQDVIKEGQEVVIQVLKEERGNKGVAVTTYISLAGKYCVLMANSANKGGVSKKIDNVRDRRILRAILKDLNIPDDKSVIMRTAAVGKKPEELKRDYNYLARMWNSIRKVAIESKAPVFVHAEDDVIRRCMRDIYSTDVEEVIIEGREAYDDFKNLTKMITPERKTNIRLYNEKIPLFYKYGVEEQIIDLYEKKVDLPSGGSIVIDQTEALVAIDVNSGKATGEMDIEETAAATNVEAAKEIARQLRLRDLAGLVVVDFIDMFNPRNRRNVERTLRDAMENDKARIQMARLSPFGLLEMSRQRLGASFFEASTSPCPCCHGRGVVRSKEIVAINIFRAIRHAGADNRVGVVHVYTSSEVATYMLNYKRPEVGRTEKAYNIKIFINHDPEMEGNEFYLRKKKGLTDEELKELDTVKLTGKVNEIIDESFYSDGSEIDAEEDNEGGNLVGEDYSRKTVHQNRKKTSDKRRQRNRNRNRNKRNNTHHNRYSKKQKPTGVKGLLKKMFSK